MSEQKMRQMGFDPATLQEILNPTFTRVTELHLLKGFRQLVLHLPQSESGVWEGDYGWGVRVRHLAHAE